MNIQYSTILYCCKLSETLNIEKNLRLEILNPFIFKTILTQIIFVLFWDLITLKVQIFKNGF